MGRLFSHGTTTCIRPPSLDLACFLRGILDRTQAHCYCRAEQVCLFSRDTCLYLVGGPLVFCRSLSMIHGLSLLGVLRSRWPKLCNPSAVSQSEGVSWRTGRCHAPTSTMSGLTDREIGLVRWGDPFVKPTFRISPTVPMSAAEILTTRVSG